MVVNNAFDGNTNGSEFVFSETLASIDGERVDEEDSSTASEDEADDEAIKIAAAAAAAVPRKKETVADQLDWMTISVDDI
jgi:hypothetical protein